MDISPPAWVGDMPWYVGEPEDRGLYSQPDPGPGPHGGLGIFVGLAETRALAIHMVRAHNDWLARVPEGHRDDGY